MTRRQRRRKDAIGGVLIFGLVALLLGAVVAGGLLRPPPMDDATFCRTDQPLAAHTLIIVDGTDKLEPRHKKRLRAAISAERAKLARFDRLTILAVNPRNPREPRVLFSLCNPGDGGTVNPLYANARKAQERWAAEFGKPLDAARDRAARTGGARASPIAQTIAAAAADPDFSDAIPQRRLVVISDLLEHDPEGFSLYRENADFPAFQAIHPGPGPDLSAVSVRIVPLDRPEQAARQTQARTRFWTPYFEASGADDVAWDASL